MSAEKVYVEISEIIDNQCVSAMVKNAPSDINMLSFLKFVYALHLSAIFDVYELFTFSLWGWWGSQSAKYALAKIEQIRPHLHV